ncbi:hypothetical protein [Streptomyces sp. NPDC001930]|uniref:hypothetical protein n=1 Tax=Streptomyces sp. NPDC001930 TaxID=3364625 RepID=UPI0036D04DC2
MGAGRAEDWVRLDQSAHISTWQPDEAGPDGRPDGVAWSRPPTESEIAPALCHDDPRLRAAALRLAGDGALPAAALPLVLIRCADTDGTVRALARTALGGTLAEAEDEGGGAGPAGVPARTRPAGGRALPGGPRSESHPRGDGRGGAERTRAAAPFPPDQAAPGRPHARRAAGLALIDHRAARGAEARTAEQPRPARMVHVAALASRPCAPHFPAPFSCSAPP